MFLRTVTLVLLPGEVFHGMGDSIINDGTIVGSAAVQPVYGLSIPLFQRLVLRLRFKVLPEACKLCPCNKAIPGAGFSLRFVL